MKKKVLCMILASIFCLCGLGMLGGCGGPPVEDLECVEFIFDHEGGGPYNNPYDISLLSPARQRTILILDEKGTTEQKRTIYVPGGCCNAPFTLDECRGYTVTCYDRKDGFYTAFTKRAYYPERSHLDSDFEYQKFTLSVPVYTKEISSKRKEVRTETFELRMEYKEGVDEFTQPDISIDESGATKNSGSVTLYTYQYDGKVHCPAIELTKDGNPVEFQPVLKNETVGYDICKLSDAWEHERCLEQGVFPVEPGMYRVIYSVKSYNYVDDAYRDYLLDVRISFYIKIVEA